MPFCQTAPLLPSVTWQQNVIEYIGGQVQVLLLYHQHPPDLLSQRSKIGDILGAALVVIKFILAFLLGAGSSGVGSTVDIKEQFHVTNPANLNWYPLQLMFIF